MWSGVARCSGGAVGRRRLLDPVLVVSKELVLREEAAVEQLDDGLAIHVDADEHELLSCASRGVAPRGRGSGGVAGANLPAVTHLVVRIVLEDLCHLRGGMECEPRERERPHAAPRGCGERTSFSSVGHSSRGTAPHLWPVRTASCERSKAGVSRGAPGHW